MDEGPFLKEERHLIDNICSLLLGYINSYKARTILFRAKRKERQRKRHIRAAGKSHKQPAAASALLKQA
jgi:hypothetical protein